ncbi:PilZ domain-containing protein [Altererythrobacter sp. KTW20L]|uniref:PilZ domain-containing protein n=1 Tax=Altererythrobacter sp. KTW20L TaxID=2942210 RepID=UPI0020BF3F4C|nr:PilZ domain-containing protein [Altererythrobacter sp. KTW20L]MCL6249798.1 PilZ domain-containing protein [Altererythrobacter sp. KTW20L]
MNNVDTRQVNRDSLFLLAQLSVDGQEAVHRVKVRNLSAGGMMAEGAAQVARGQLVHVELRNIGWVKGSVAWKQDDRFGIAFIDEIDPTRARAPQQTVEEPSGVSLMHRAIIQPQPAPVDKNRLRKL